MKRRYIIAGVTGLAVVATSAFILSRYVHQAVHIPARPNITATTQGDLIHSFSWKMVGATVSDNTLRIAKTDLAIVNQDGSAGQPSPAVNLAGSYLAVSGDFSYTVGLRNPAGENTISLYGVPPIISDESRADTHALHLTLNKDRSTLRIRLTNGDKTSGYATDKTLTVAFGDTTEITVARYGHKIALYNGDAPLAEIDESGLFDSGNLWLGFDTTASTGMILNRLSINALPGGSVNVKNCTDIRPIATTTGLNAIASGKRSDFKVGAAMSLGPMVADAKYSDLMLGGNFGLMTPENAIKFQFVHPAKDLYAFEDGDALVTLAASKGLVVHGHTLVFGEANPAWVQAIAAEHPEQLQAVMVDHIKTVVGHYKGKVTAWDVINEPLADNTPAGEYGLRQHIWYKAMGTGYIATALRAAHEADPNAQLWINEFGLETDDSRFSDMLDLITELKREGVPLYGIGFQAHIDSSDTSRDDASIDTAKLNARFEALRKLGIKARISELDISSESEMPIFAQVLSTCFHNTNCTDLTFWGATDAYSAAATVTGNRYEPGFGLPWDEKYNASPAVKQMRQVLGSQ